MAKAHKFTPTGLVGHWKFGHGTGTNRRGVIVDESVNGNNGTVYGVPALVFDGTNDKAAVDTPWNNLAGARYVCFAGWVNITDTAATRTILADSHNSSNTPRLSIWIDSSDKLAIVVRAGAAGDSGRTATSSSAITQGSWIRLMVAVDLGTDGTVANGFAAYAWVDGQVFAMGAFDDDATQGTFVDSVPDSIQYGEIATGAPFDFAGSMRMFGYGPTASLVTIDDAQRFHDNSQAWLDNSGWDAWYYCNEGAAGAVDNAEGTAGQDLTITGATWDVTANGGDIGSSFTAGNRAFDGVDDKVVISNDASLIISTGYFQIHVWARCSATQPNANGSFLGKGDTGAGEWMFRLNRTSSKYQLNFYGDVGGILAVSAHGTGYNDDTIHLFSAIRDMTVEDVRIYVDGVQVASDEAAGDDLTSAKDFEIGTADGSASRFVAADIYQVLFGKATQTFAQAEAAMTAIYAQGAFV